MLRECPHHGLDLRFQMQTFYNGLNFTSKQLINASSGGTTRSKTLEELEEYIENITTNIHS
jgi:hypothetical protein